MEQQVTVFEAVGGQPWFDALVERFYAGVAEDPSLRPMYPADLTVARRKLALFLGQYWGGPTTYSDERGHPRLRMRHVPFEIAKPERDAWMSHMANAVRDAELPSELEEAMLGYFESAATHLINSTGR